MRKVSAPRKFEDDAPKATGQKIEDATAEMYGEAYSIVKRILDDEANIPSKVKRNILVKMAR